MIPNIKYKILCGLIGLMSLTMGCDTSADDHLKSANKFQSKADYENAILLYDKALAKDPQLKDAYIQKGFCYEYLGQEDKAVATYQQLLSFDPGNTLALYSIGLCKYARNKFPEALEYYNRALLSKGIDPADTSKIQFVFTLNKDLMDPRKLEFDVDAYKIYYDRGLAFYAENQIKNAYRDFYRCINENYKPGECYYMAGLCWQSVNKKDKACDAFRSGALYGDSLSRIQLVEYCK